MNPFSAEMLGRFALLLYITNVVCRVTLLHRIGMLFVKNTPMARRAALSYGWKHCGCWGGEGGLLLKRARQIGRFSKEGVRSLSIPPLSLNQKQESL